MDFHGFSWFKGKRVSWPVAACGAGQDPPIESYTQNRVLSDAQWLPGARMFACLWLWLERDRWIDSSSTLDAWRGRRILFIPNTISF